MTIIRKGGKNEMKDTIYRQDALDEILRFYGYPGEDVINRIHFGLSRLPSAQPERKMGKWIPQDLNKSNGVISTAVYYYPKCSVCGANANFTNFCPNCGADMRGGQE